MSPYRDPVFATWLLALTLAVPAFVLTPADPEAPTREPAAAMTDTAPAPAPDAFVASGGLVADRDEAPDTGAIFYSHRQPSEPGAPRDLAF